MRKNILLTLMVLSSFALTAQTAIGSFTAHTAMHAFSSVAVDATTVYAATDNGLMLLEKSSMYDEHPDISSWTKVEGLSDIDIVGVFHVSQQNSLIICYADGNIDLIQNDRVMNIRDVKDKSLTGSKRLQTCRELDGKTYLVYPFGVVILDVDERVVSDTWFTKRDGEQLTPTDIAVANQRFYISTTEGVFSMPMTSPALSNFSQWTQESSLNVSFLSVASDKLFAMRKPGEYETEAWDTLYTWDGDSWHSTGKLTNPCVICLHSMTPYLFVTGMGWSSWTATWSGFTMLCGTMKMPIPMFGRLSWTATISGRQTMLTGWYRTI